MSSRLGSTIRKSPTLECRLPGWWCQVTLHRQRHCMCRVSPTTAVQRLEKSGQRRITHPAEWHFRTRTAESTVASLRFTSLLAFFPVSGATLGFLRKTKSTRAPAETLMRLEQARRFTMLAALARNHVKSCSPDSKNSCRVLKSAIYLCRRERKRD